MKILMRRRRIVRPRRTVCLQASERAYPHNEWRVIPHPHHLHIHTPTTNTNQTSSSSNNTRARGRRAGPPRRLVQFTVVRPEFAGSAYNISMEGSLNLQFWAPLLQELPLQEAQGSWRSEALLLQYPDPVLAATISVWLCVKWCAHIPYWMILTPSLGVREGCVESTDHACMTQHTHMRLYRCSVFINCRRSVEWDPLIAAPGLWTLLAPVALSLDCERLAEERRYGQAGGHLGWVFGGNSLVILPPEKCVCVIHSSTPQQARRNSSSSHHANKIPEKLTQNIM